MRGAESRDGGLLGPSLRHGAGRVGLQDELMMDTLIINTFIMNKFI